MDDGAVVLGQELKYSVGVRNLELEHRRDEFSIIKAPRAHENPQGG